MEAACRRRIARRITTTCQLYGFGTFRSVTRITERNPSNRTGKLLVHKCLRAFGEPQIADTITQMIMDLKPCAPSHPKTGKLRQTRDACVSALEVEG
jgi:hypothetical protein